MAPGPPSPVALPVTLLETLDRARELGFLGPGPVARHVDHALGFDRALRWALAIAVDRPAGNAGEGPATDAGGGSRFGGPAGAVMAEGGGGDPPGRLVDLGSGGGVPGLVLASTQPEWDVTLLDANARRCELLEEAVRRLGWTQRVTVRNERAELTGRQHGVRGTFTVATARSFGTPPVTAECAAPLLVVGGCLVTSEPPASGRGPGQPGLPASPPLGDRLTEPPEPAGTAAGSPLVGPGRRWPAEGLAELGMVPLLPYRSGFAYQVVRQAALCPERYPRRVGVPAKRPLF